MKRIVFNKINEEIHYASIDPSDIVGFNYYNVKEKAKHVGIMMRPLTNTRETFDFIYFSRGDYYRQVLRDREWQIKLKQINDEKGVLCYFLGIPEVLHWVSDQLEKKK